MAIIAMNRVSVSALVCLLICAQSNCDANAFTQLVANDGKSFDLFGYSVALSDDAAIVGTPFANYNFGAAYVFRNTASGWAQEAVLTDPNESDSGALGNAVALAGNSAFVAAPAEARGIVYVFSYSGSQWTQQQKLQPPLGDWVGCFGCSLAVSGNTLLIGALGATVGSNAQQGAVYVFQFDGSVWSQTQILTANDGLSGDEFGIVSLDGGTALIGAPGATVGGKAQAGAAYVFAQSSGVWTQQQKLLPDDGDVYNWYGNSVAVRGKTALIGAPGKQLGTDSNRGVAYVLSFDGSSWSQRQEISAPDGGYNDQFGFSVALSDSGILVGARGNVAGYNQMTGAAYVFNPGGDSWDFPQKLTATNSVGGTPTTYANEFGFAVAMQKRTVLVGAICATVGSNSCQGAGYIFASVGDPLFRNGFE